MNNAELAKKIRAAIFDRSSDEGGAISKEQMDDAIERTLIAMSTPLYAATRTWTSKAPRMDCQDEPLIISAE